MGEYISFSGINLKSLKYILLMSVSNVLNIFIYGFIYIECFYPMNIYRILYEAILGENKNKDYSNHRVIDPFFSYLGIIILVFFFVKDKNESDTNDVKDEESENELTSQFTPNRTKTTISLVYYRKKEYLKSMKGLIYYIFIIILWIIEENLLIIYGDIFQDLDFWFFELIFISIIHSKMFHTKIFSHQKLGITISVIVGSLLKIYSINITLFNGSTDVFYNKYRPLIAFALFYFLLITTRSYVNTEIKTFLDIKYISQRILLISYGIAGALLCFFTSIFTSSVSCPEVLKGYVCKKEHDGKFYFDEINNYFESGKNFLVRLIIIGLGMITFFSYIYYYTLIIKFYTPVHVIFAFPIQFFLEKTFLLIFSAIFFRDQLFQKENQWRKFLLDETGDIAAITGFLLYLEMIELHFCNLDFNIKRKIIRRGQEDYICSFSPIPVDSPIEEILGENTYSDLQSENISSNSN